jgi:phosphoglycolate phosphatase-like HAD superfamily hydrolase
MGEDNKPQSLVVFDMDGVIVDVSRSYRETVRQAASLFFKDARLWAELPDPLFSLSDLAAVKQSGGLNNDWDLTFTVIGLLLTRINGVFPSNRSADPWLSYRQSMEHLEVSALARYLKTKPQPLTRLLEQYGKRAHPLAADLYRGDVGSGNIIKQIFQEIYLGADLFESTYGIHPVVYRGEGYIQREALIADKAVLGRLAEKNILAIATGRPKAEAEHPLDRFGIRSYFSIVFTLDDCLREEERIFKSKGLKVCLSKPDPFMLDAAAALLAGRISSFYYIGDMPDDIRAAANAATRFKGIGFLMSSPDRDRLRKDLAAAGANEIVEDFKALELLIDADQGHPLPCAKTG